MTNLQQLDTLPPELLTSKAHELHQHFERPTLIHLPGTRQRPLFLSILLHGNETTGLTAVQQLLKKYTATPLPRALSLFLGNTEAAAHHRRRLADQPDYNRVWPGTHLPDSPETRLMAEIVDIMRDRKVFASIDIHNNTGLNPHYACVNDLAAQNLQLANLFSRTIVYFIQPRGTQSAALSALCPATTIECGKPGEPHGIAHALEFIEACLHVSAIPDHPPAPHDIAVYHSLARVRIPEDTPFGFADKTHQPRPDQLIFRSDLETLNFRDAEPGLELGTCPANGKISLIATREDGLDITADFFTCDAGKLKLRKHSMLSMLTRDERVIRQDCLCYLMERLDPPHSDTESDP